MFLKMVAALAIAASLLAVPMGMSSDPLLGLLLIYLGFLFAGIYSLGRTSSVTLVLATAAIAILDTVLLTQQFTVSSGMRKPVGLGLRQATELLLLPCLYLAVTISIGQFRRRRAAGDTENLS